MPCRFWSSEATAPPRPISSIRAVSNRAVSAPPAAIACRRAMSPASSVTRVESFSSLSRSASRSNPRTSVCSPTHSRSRGRNPRDGRRVASARSAGVQAAPVASRIHASADRTATRSTKSVPTPPVIGTPAADSATCTGAIVALTRVSTAISAGAAPEESAASTAATVAATGSRPSSTFQPGSVGNGAAAARMVLATLRRL